MNNHLKKIIKPVVFRVVPKNIVVWRMSRTLGKQIALTFDDGPAPSFTESVLDILHNHKVRATFFLVGNKIKKHPDVALKIKNGGHEIGNHSFTHNNYSRSKLRNVKAEIDQTQDIIRKTLGFEPVLFRPPYGILSFSIFKHCIMQRLTIAMWSIDTEDHAVKSASELWNKLNQFNIESGDIILMHDNIQFTIEMLPAVVQQLRAQGFNFLTMSELLRTRG